MPPPIQKLEIANYRGLRELTIHGMGRINLITGRNNSGKSTVLEAIRLLASNGQASMLHQIIGEREFASADDDESSSSLDFWGGVSSVSQIFHGFPAILHDASPIRIVATFAERTRDLEVRVVPVAEERTADGVRRIQWIGSPDSRADGRVPEVELALLIRAAGVDSFVPLDSFRSARSRLATFGDRNSKMTIPCRILRPSDGQRTDNFAPLWDEIAISDREADVLDVLRIIEPRIQAMSVIGSNDGSRLNRVAIVRAEGVDHPIPLRTLGDGLNRLFGMALSLVNSAGGLLLIDEFENGMHFSVLGDVWRTIFRLARKHDVQVIATTHSWDVIEEFQRTAAEDSDDGVLIRLARRNRDVIPTVFTEDELAIVTRDRIEVR